MEDINTQKRVVKTNWATSGSSYKYENNRLTMEREQTLWIDITMGDTLHGMYCNISAMYTAPITPYEDDE